MTTIAIVGAGVGSARPSPAASAPKASRAPSCPAARTASMPSPPT